MKAGKALGMSERIALASARKNGELGLQIAQEIGYPNQIKLNAGLLSKVAFAEGNYKEALEMRDLEVLMRDSIASEETKKAAAKQHIKYEYEKAQAIKDKEHEKLMALSAEREEKQKIVSYSAAGVSVLLIAFLLFVLNRLKVTRRQKKIIELKEQETHAQKEIIEEKHKEITDSINYAERIQRSLLASKELLDENLGVTSSADKGGVSRSERNYFVFFSPKDVVSGDFYWASKLNNGEFALVTADSTGHGVPGAIMSILNIACLNEAIKEGAYLPNEILNHTRTKIIEVLKRDGSKEGGKDGMDCSLLVINKEKTQLSFALANNPVFIVRTHPNPPEGRESQHAAQFNDEGLVRGSSSPSGRLGGAELLEFKPDKMPVGKHDKENESFRLQIANLQKGDVVYALTDGFQDQFGGDKGKKYMIKNLKGLLLQIAHLPMQEQEQKLSVEFTNWKGENEQVDDVCVIGVRI